MIKMNGGREGNSPNPTIQVPPTDNMLFHHQADFESDDFHMFDFKIRRCTRPRTHDWTECPYAHPGEKARRRDPRQFHYSATPCPDFRKSNYCKRGDGCEHAHGIFECWLHPARYRTQPCRDGTSCVRPICFFAHTHQQLRVVTQQSPRGTVTFGRSYFSLSSPTSTLMSQPFDSPPVSPSYYSINDVVFALRGLDVNKGKTGLWNVEEEEEEEEPVMERVESGRNLRAKIFEKLSKENSLNRFDDLLM